MEKSLQMMVLLVIFQLPISEETYCDDDIYLRVGHQGVISCDFGEFDVVGWLNPTKDPESAVPFIYLEDSEIIGPGAQNGEYSMFPNGSLIIINVTISHEKNYTVSILKNGELSHHVVPVHVYVLPVPEYPVVNVLTDQGRVVVNSPSGEVSLKCTMDHIRPAVPLELVFVSPISYGLSVETIPSTLDNHDGTYNVSLDIQLTGINLPCGIFSLECRAAESFGHLFKSVSEIELSVFDLRCRFPSVNGLDSQQHVVLDLDREGVLDCSMDRVPQGLILTWDLIQHDSPVEIAFDGHNLNSYDNGDGTNNILLISSYRTTSNSVQRLVVKCMLSGKDADLYPLYTTVELNFPATDGRHIQVFPAVNGLEPQQHVVLDVNREGTLNCSMDRVSQNVELEWNYVNHYSLDEIALQSQSHSSLDNGDGTFSITSVTRYKTTDGFIPCVILKCQVSGDEADLYPPFTAVELRFPEVPCSDNSCAALDYAFIAFYVLFVIWIPVWIFYLCLVSWQRLQTILKERRLQARISRRHQDEEMDRRGNENPEEAMMDRRGNENPEEAMGLTSIDAMIQE